MSKLKLSLDKDTLVRLQDQQLQAAFGGANDPHPESNTGGADDRMAELLDPPGTDPVDNKSCCSKSCNK